MNLNVQSLTTQNNIAIIQIPNFITHEDCDEIIKLSAAYLKKATVFNEKENKEECNEGRTAEMGWPGKYNHSVIESYCNKLAEVTTIPIIKQEEMQVIHYLKGGEYRPHFDAFLKDSQVVQREGNRLLTAIVYLNDDFKGGETIFPNLNLNIKPMKGSLLLFDNLLGEEQHPSSFHGGSPVLEGEKWIGSIWIRK